MAIYLCSFRNITRSQGRSAVAAAAYRSGQKLTNRWDGCTHDYARKGGVVYTAVLLPPNAPAAWSDREALWNAVETAEKSSRCRLCRECIVALPREFSRAQQIALAEQYVKENFVAAGMCADLAIHDPGQGGNPHAHILLTVRPLDSQGRWEAKSQVEYRLRRDGEERGFTPGEVRDAQAQGWEKQYRYQVKGAKLWLTPSEAAAKGLQATHRVSRSPRTTLHGRENPTAAHWNSPQRIREWRERWAALVNEKFAALGRPDRVDHRSYLDRGQQRLPQRHLGPHASQDTQAYNALVDQFNRGLWEYQRTEALLQAKLEQTRQTLRGCQRRLADNQARAAGLRQSLGSLSRLANQEESDAQRAQATLDLLCSITAEADATLRRLEDQLAKLGRFHPTRRRALLEELDQVQGKLEDQTCYLQSLLQSQGFRDQSSIDQARAEAQDKQRALSGLSQSLTELQAQAQQLRQTIADTLAQVPEPLLDQFRPPACPGQETPPQPTRQKGVHVHGQHR